MSLTLRQSVATILSALALLSLACFQTGCQNEPARESTPLLAEAGSGESNASPAAPANPYKEVAKNLLERTVFETAGPSGTQIELRDVFVAPGTKVENVSLPGPAVLRVVSGEGSATIADKSQELGMGTAVTLPQGTPCALESRGIMPLVLRAHIVVPQ